MDKKILVIIILSLIIVGLVWLIFTGKNSADIIIESLRIEQSELVRSNEIIRLENSKIRKESSILRANNTELGNIIDEFRAGSRETRQDLNEYGRINNDLADFIQQNQPME